MHDIRYPVSLEQAQAISNLMDQHTKGNSFKQAEHQLYFDKLFASKDPKIVVAEINNVMDLWEPADCLFFFNMVLNTRDLRIIPHMNGEIGCRMVDYLTAATRLRNEEKHKAAQ